MTSSNLEKESWKFQRNDLKVTLKLFEFPNFKSSWELFIFSTNYFTPKNKYMEIRVKYFPTIENKEKINLKLFCYLKNDFY
mgnify:CR=1 FL=1